MLIPHSLATSMTVVILPVCGDLAMIYLCIYWFINITIHLYSKKIAKSLHGKKITIFQSSVTMVLFFWCMWWTEWVYHIWYTQCIRPWNIGVNSPQLNSGESLGIQAWDAFTFPREAWDFSKAQKTRVTGDSKPEASGWNGMKCIIGVNWIIATIAIKYSKLRLHI